MFTGIVTDIGEVKGVSGAGDTRFEIKTSLDISDAAIGASIACAGACLTVIEKGTGWFAVEASAETLSKTTLGIWQPGTRINLERALRLGDELGGHMVTGHVDGVGTVAEVAPIKDSVRIDIDAPAALAKFIAGKGSVTVDGVSLTMNAVSNTVFSVNVIAHTQAVTTLGGLAPGAAVNLEIDVLARYVSRLQEMSG